MKIDICSQILSLIVHCTEQIEHGKQNGTAFGTHDIEYIENDDVKTIKFKNIEIDDQLKQTNWSCNVCLSKHGTDDSCGYINNVELFCNDTMQGELQFTGFRELFDAGYQLYTANKQQNCTVNIDKSLPSAFR